MRQRVLTFLRSETILIVATLLAIISCFIVPPDGQYGGYVHVSTISQLVCLMLVVVGFQRIGVFRIIGSSLLHRVHTARGVVLTFIALTFISAMFITNDVALLTFVPFALAVLVMAHMEDKAIIVCALMTVAANTGSMLTPVGNAHNLYFKALTGMSTGHFLRIMAPYSILAAVLLVVVTCVVFRGRRIAEFDGMDSKGFERGVLAPDPTRHQPDEIKVTGYGAGYGGWRAIVYTGVFVVCVLAVSDMVPLWVMCAVTFVAMVVCDRGSFRHADWALPLTFIMFFVFIGNMKRVPEFAGIAQAFVGQHPLEVSIISSQIISNVPASLLLSGFCDQWVPLIIGTNIGGMGTLIASMASLITYKNYTRQYPRNKGRYLGVYTAISVMFLLLMYGLAVIIE
ncbi:anion transporter [Bifidobacterium pseudolongum]|uniref:Citrate transporter n=2 Tax=Bifidobacterium pseudolongum TaxID=1694 RepID=A0AB37X225_9BIFI|nr:SLC13 family permease [Bifidobacterium pseudolongum]KFI79512.1 transporter [Bifidobacterium pseudolongum subsp. pseudolongum]PKV01506.1 citrate transporter [Bifidobacterium pseudolongum subsp. pseudolongum]PKV08391.1 citrate transporter [Bifidobacterium pseudolongum subsp. pseudolongum]RYQ22137.1 citrate transporter [Bifidobacterium pseudolongum subsp. pseudolongum]RYQ38494.1 citrate transporter [Bifidobacterium pseudolongum subsp. globosum]